MSMEYIYINFNDLTENAKSDIIDMAIEEVIKEWTKEDDKKWKGIKDQIIEERVDQKLIDWSYQGRFVFNI